MKIKKIFLLDNFLFILLALILSFLVPDVMSVKQKDLKARFKIGDKSRLINGQNVTLFSLPFIKNARHLSLLGAFYNY
ncbi:MAG: hypothetical protein NUV70_08685 [Caldiserica bacterium]|nr:hypothetical protein [Caldisericota bacterium]